jgi:hypothetical protein
MMMPPHEEKAEALAGQVAPDRADQVIEADQRRHEPERQHRAGQRIAQSCDEQGASGEGGLGQARGRNQHDGDGQNSQGRDHR